MFFLANYNLLIEGYNLRHVFTLKVPEIDSSSEEGLKPNEMLGSVEIKNVKFRYPARPEVQVRWIVPPTCT